MPSRVFDPETFLAEPGAGKKLLLFNDKAVVYSQGDPGSTLFYLKKGRVKLVVTSMQGREAVVGMLGAGDFFGQEGLAGHKGRLATAVAMSECSVTRIDKNVVTALLHHETEFADLFVGYLLTHIARVHEDLVDQLFNSSEKRLARALLLLARFGKKEKREFVITPKITHEVLAETVGTTRARISFFMKKFREMGFIDYEGGLRIHESLINVILHE